MPRLSKANANIDKTIVKKAKQMINPPVVNQGGGLGYATVSKTDANSG